MKATETRIKLTWGGVILLAGIAVFSIVKGMEGVAATSVAGIITIVTGYHASRTITKNSAFKSPSTQSPIE